MDLNIVTFVTETLGSNLYVVYKTDTAVIIDAGGSVDELARFLKEKNLEAAAVLLTHAHFDHIAKLEEIVKLTGAKVYQSEKEKDMLVPSPTLRPQSINSLKADSLIKEDCELEIADLKFKAILTPGHTPGCVSYFTDKYIFTGDTLFAGSIGRTDLPGGSYKQIMESIKTKLLKLPDETKVLPGHGVYTTIKNEKKYNPFINLNYDF